MKKIMMALLAMALVINILNGLVIKSLSVEISRTLAALII